MLRHAPSTVPWKRVTKNHASVVANLATGTDQAHRHRGHRIRFSETVHETGSAPAAIAAGFADDATWILPDATTYKGRAEIDAAAKAFPETYDSATSGTMTLDKLVVISDTEALAFTTLTFAMTVKGKTETLRNPSAGYWRKGADGQWRTAYEVNALGPVKEMAAQKK